LIRTQPSTTWYAHLPFTSTLRLSDLEAGITTQRRSAHQEAKNTYTMSMCETALSRLHRSSWLLSPPSRPHNLNRASHTSPDNPSRSSLPHDVAISARHERRVAYPTPFPETCSTGGLRLCARWSLRKSIRVSKVGTVGPCSFEIVVIPEVRRDCSWGQKHAGWITRASGFCQHAQSRQPSTKLRRELIQLRLLAGGLGRLWLHRN
jgi:hypothetical protein